MGKTYFGFLGFTALSIGMAVAACSGERTPIPPESTDAGENGGAFSAGGMTGEGNGPGDNAGGTPGNGMPGPVVTITSPTAVTDPNVGPVLANDAVAIMNNAVTAVCNVKQADGAGAKPVNPTSVTLEMLDATGKTVQMFPGMQSVTKANDYSAKFVFTTVPNGKVAFRCTAKDTAGTKSTSVISTFVDHGPDIMPVSPEPDSAHPFGSLEVEFSVAEAPLDPSDKKAGVDTVTLVINGSTIDLKDAEDKPGHYKLDLNLAKLFPTAPNGKLAIIITATNGRAVTNTDTYHFLVDSEGPVIKITSPKDGDYIAGNRQLAFTITDTGSGVKEDSIVVTVNQNPPYTYDSNNGLWTPGNMGAYTFSLDSKTIIGTSVQVNVTVRADDVAGNSSDGASATYYLDTAPPTVDLDPPLLQEVKKVSGQYVCSEPFDPLGTVANDLQVVPGYVITRALAWDEANETAPSGGVIDYFSGVGTVKLYIQGNPDAGLLTDEDGDGVCDDVDTSLPSFKDLHALLPTGNSAFTPSAPPIPGVCASPDSTQTATALCGGTSDLTRVIQHEQVGGTMERVVYAIPEKGGECNASQLNLSSLDGVTQNGWVCLAARAVDKATNVGISAPLRICLSDPMLGAAPPCASSSVSPPSCTRKCTPPPHFRAGEAHPYIYVP
jgi:hypothetical protein